MYHMAHISAYWEHRALAIPGGAALPERRVEYWLCIMRRDTYRIMSGQVW
jgi:hypothetical protein